MRSAILCLTVAVLATTGASAWTDADKDAIFAANPEMPALGAFKMQELTPNLLDVFLKINNVLAADGALHHVNSIEREVINTVTSAANGCELCLSFHTASLARAEAMPMEEIETMAAGGIPNGKYKNLVIAAKMATAHKGIYLEREKLHLAELGFSLSHLMEINFLVGQMTSNNYVFASLINEGAPVEDFLKALGPFKHTVYKDLKKTEM